MIYLYHIPYIITLISLWIINLILFLTRSKKSLIVANLDNMIYLLAASRGGHGISFVIVSYCVKLIRKIIQK